MACPKKTPTAPDVSETQYTLTVNVSPSGSGTVSKSSNQTKFANGSQVTLTANPASGYQFSRWEGGATGTANPSTVTMNSNKTVTAVFTATTTQYTLTVNVSPSGGGTVTKSPNQTQFASGTTVTLTANPASGYQFSRWEGGATGTANPSTVTMNSNKTVTAVFTATTTQYTLTVNVSPSGGGTVTKSPNQTQFASGTTVTLTANPASGYLFSRWEGGATGTANPTTIMMTGNKTVTAVFVSSSSPLIKLSTSSLSFSATQGEASPASKIVNITNGGTGSLNGISRSFQDGTPTWLGASLSGNTAPAILTVKPLMTSLLGNPIAPGTYTSRIAISAPGAGNSPQFINVSFVVHAPEELRVYATYDNGVMLNSLDSANENTVYSNSMLGVGIDYASAYPTGYNSIASASALWFDIDSQISGRNIKKATFRIYVYAARGDFSIIPIIRISALANPWNPNTLTWNILSGMSHYVEGQSTLYVPESVVLPLDFDVTTIVQNWASGTMNNYGFRLGPEGHFYPEYTSLQTTFFQSLEFWWEWDQRPQLIIEFQ